MKLKLYENTYTNLTLKSKIKDAYKKAYPSDELGDEIPSNITFGDLFIAINNSGNVKYNIYDMCANDSVVRARVFEMLSAITGYTYDEIYDLWLDVEDRVFL